MSTRYHVGDLVLIKSQGQNNDGNSKKLLPVFKGPFQITKELGHNRFEVADVRGSERSQKPNTGTAAIENMKPWIRIGDWDRWYSHCWQHELFGIPLTRGVSEGPDTLQHCGEPRLFDGA